ncbi:hypothetical protein B1H10_00150 [candidate division KSB1 bacterium 4484_188]|nr:MAG: hypothetical protein B1H10_00150 [candidate division KSB1 bacterium 4484_188]
MKINLNKISGERHFLKTLFLVLLGTSIIFAAQSLIRVGASVDKSVITIGDRITYSLTIEHDKSIKIEQPGPGANLGQFEIKDYKIYDPVEKGNIVTQQFDYVISVFDTGKFVIPPFPVAFAPADTSTKYQVIMSEPIEITVNSVLTAEDAEIHDIKPPISIPFNYRRLILLVVAGLLIAAAVLLFLYILRQRKKGKPLFRKEVIRPAHEIALEALEAVAAEWREMLEAGKHKELFTRISEIFRTYLENRFFINAMEETSFEIIDSLREVGLEEEQQKIAREILELSTLVKFAKYIPEEQETEQCLEQLKSFVEATRLVFEPVENQIEMSETEGEEKAAEAVAEDNKTV